VKRFLLALLLSGLIAGALVCGAAQQQAAPGQETVIKTQATEVVVPVTVTDDKGRFVSNLGPSDFRIFDEDRPQRVADLIKATEKEPLVIGFLLDLSNRNKIQWKDYKEMAQELIWTLLPGDRKLPRSGYLIGYSTEAKLLVGTTTDGSEIAERVGNIAPGGGSALYDAIYMACRKLVDKEPPYARRVVIVVGDGHDVNSSKSLDEVLELAQREQVTIYGISTVSFGFTTPEQGSLVKLAGATGGFIVDPLGNPYTDVPGYLSNRSDAGNYALAVGTGAYTAAKLKSITDAVAKLQGALTTGYILRYVPDVDPEQQPKLMRRIRVEIPSLPNAKVTARAYYYPEGVPVPAATEAPAKPPQERVTPGAIQPATPRPAAKNGGR
jgi:VWFA-related protein